MGISQRLQIATSPEELEALLLQGAKYQEASDKTRRQWQVRAKHRRAQLEA